MIRRWVNKKNIVELAKYAGLVFCFVAIETIFRVQPEIRTRYVSIMDEVPLLYDILWALIFVSFLQMIPFKNVRGIIYLALHVFLCIFMFSEYIYCRIFGRIYGVRTLQYAGEAQDFGGMIQSYLDGSAWLLLGLFILFGAAGYFLLTKLNACLWKYAALRGALAVLGCSGCILFIPNLFLASEDADQGPTTYMFKKTVYKEWIDNKRAVGMFGAYEFLARDMYLLCNKSPISEEERASVDIYFQENDKGRNEMTGLLEGKNVILVLMESIDDWLINEETTPTMCRMMEEGIHFTNMYTPVFGSAATLNTEFCSYTGITAPSNGVPLVNYTNNQYPYGLPHLFRERGYSAKAFHYNVSSYYNRLNIHNAVGFEEYISYMDYEEDELAQQDSTLSRNDEIYHKFTEDVPFFNFVITFSAHASIKSGAKAYSYEDDAITIYPEYKGMYASEEMDSISAKARLTDDMFSGLLVRLEEDGLLEDTVIIAYGDHYDYTISDQEYLKELSDAGNVYELSKTPFFIWAEGIEPQEISKVVNTTDIYPTICNLFSLDNHGYFTGNDVFDPDYEGYAYWQDGSWIRSDGAYYSESGEVKGTMSNDEMKVMREMISEKLKVNQLILETDYFRQ